MTSTAPVLALDIGSTGLRAGRFTESGRQVGATTAARYRDDTAEQGRPDALIVLGALVGALRSMDLAGVEVVATSVVWHAVIAVDEHDEPLAPVVTWEARLPLHLRERITDATAGVWSHESSGAYLHSSFSSASVVHLLDTGADRFVDLGSWLVGRLAGRRVAWPENIASGSSLWRQADRTWDEAVLGSLGIEQARLGDHWSEAVQSTSPLVPDLVDVSWMPVVGDGVCHNLGQDSVDGRLAVTVGTSGSLRALGTAGPHGGPGHGLWRYRLEGGLVATGGAITSVGNTLEWVQGFLGEPIDWDSLLGEPPTSEVLADVSVFGRRGPDYPWDATGSIIGLSASVTRADVARAFALDVWRPFRDHLVSMREVVGHERDVVAEGGVIAHNPVALQLLADALGTAVGRTSVSEPSLAGAGLIGAHARREGRFDLAGTARAIRSGVLAAPEIVSTVAPRPEWSSYLARRWVRMDHELRRHP